MVDHAGRLFFLGRPALTLAAMNTSWSPNPFQTERAAPAWMMASRRRWLAGGVEKRALLERWTLALGRRLEPGSDDFGSCEEVLDIRQLASGELL